MGRYIHAGAIGAIFEMILEDDNGPVDLSAATSLEFIFSTPDGSVFTRDGTVSGPPDGGKIIYTSVDGDFDDTGEWRWQARVGFPDSSFDGDIADFEVVANLA